MPANSAAYVRMVEARKITESVVSCVRTDPTTLPQVLVPLYLIILVGYAAGAQRVSAAGASPGHSSVSASHSCATLLLQAA